MACELSCSGYPGLAVVIRVLGVVGVLWFVFFVVRKIFSGVNEREGRRKER